MSVATTDAKRRVKLYALNASRQWDDKGTGHVTSCYHEPLDGMSLLVRNESDGSLLLESKIQLDTQYQKQQGTLIVWTESDNYDLALSFQEKDGCNEIWEKICQVQGRDPSYEQDQDDEQEEIRINIIECDYDKLPMILEQINAFSQTTRRRDVLATDYIENDYINKLLQIFRQADEKQDLPTLYKLYEIFKQLFLYDRTALTEAMLGESVIMDIIGVFEYEPPTELPQQDQQQQQQQHQHQQQQQQPQENNENSPEHQQETTNTTPNNHTEVHNEERDTDLSIQEDSVACDQSGQDQGEKENQKSSEPMQGQESQEVVDDEHPKQSEHPPQPTAEPHDEHLEQLDEQQAQLTTELNEHQHQPQKSTLPETDQQLLTTTTTTTINNNNVITNNESRKHHREFLTNGTTFKEVIPFSNQKLVDKIHQTYRVQYLQSSVLPAPSILEENAYNALSNILFFNKVEIVSMIQENEEFLQNLFNQIISNQTGTDRKRELILFLREYCQFSQTIQPKQRDSFFKTLASLKILSAVEVALSSDDQVTKSAAIDIFTYLVEYSPHMTREHAVQQREGIIEPPNSNAQTANILKLVIEHITTDQDPELGTATQLSCIIKLLMDPETMASDTVSKVSFLELFYYTCMQSLVQPIKNATTPGGDIELSANDRRTAQLLSIMLELLTFFMEHHYTHMRNYITSNDLLARIISLIKSRHKFLVLSVIRFFRKILATKDDVYYDIIMNEDLFSPIIRVLKNNNGRYNLLDSAILEMFEYIQNEDLLPLMNHVLTNFGPFLESIDYVSTFKVMRQKKEALHERRAQHSPMRPRSPIESQQLYFGNHSRREMDEDGINLAWCMESAETDVDDVGDVDTDPDKDIDPDSGDANTDSDLNMPELEFTMNGSQNEEEDIEEEDEEEVEEEEEDDIRMDDEDCEDELEPQLKKKKTK